LAKEGDYARPVTLALEGDALVLDMGGQGDRRPLAELKDAQRFSGMIVFWFGPNDGVALPERALADPGQAEAILAAARRNVVAS
jgi:hypothetical protein